MIQAASGTPQYSGVFVPEIWSGTLLVKFYATTTISAITNTDYEGDIKDVGDKVIIRTTPSITMRPYVKNQPLQIERPEAPNITFPVEQATYFNFICDDIDAYQSDIALMDDWSGDAAEQMKIYKDTAFFADVYSDAHASNKGATAGAKTSGYNMGAAGAPVEIDQTNVLSHMINCDTVLYEQDAPETGRYFVMPPWMAGFIKQSDLKDASLSGDGTSMMRHGNGRLGQIGNFTLYISNLFTAVADGGGETAWHCLAGQIKAITFAAQLNKLGTLTSEQTFGTIVRGLDVYDWKVLKPEALVDFYCYKG